MTEHTSRPLLEFLANPSDWIGFDDETRQLIKAEVKRYATETRNAPKLWDEAW